MKIRALALLLLAACAAATAPPPSASTWTITKDGSPAGIAVLTVSATDARVEYRDDERSPTTLFVQRGGTIWLHTMHGEVDFATISAMNTPYTVAPALLNADWSAPYRYRGVTATYFDDRIEIAGPDGAFTLRRQASGAGNAP